MLSLSLSVGPPQQCDSMHLLLSLPYLTFQRGHILPHIVVRVVTLYAVQLVAIVSTPDGIDVAVHDTHTVVSVLLL